MERLQGEGKEMIWTDGSSDRPEMGGTGWVGVESIFQIGWNAMEARVCSQ